MQPSTDPIPFVNFAKFAEQHRYHARARSLRLALVATSGPGTLPVRACLVSRDGAVVFVAEGTPLACHLALSVVLTELERLSA
jgi:hypothetical protein